MVKPARRRTCGRELLLIVAALGLAVGLESHLGAGPILSRSAVQKRRGKQKGVRLNDDDVSKGVHQIQNFVLDHMANGKQIPAGAADDMTPLVQLFGSTRNGRS